MRSHLREPEAQRLPDAEAVQIDRKHYYRQVLHGYYQFDCVVGEGRSCPAKFYIPEGSVYNQPTIFVGVPGGRNPWQFMVESGWKDLADAYGLYLVLMEAPNGQSWHGDETDLAYLNALNNDLAVRPMFCAFQPNFYAAAYGDAADAVGAQSRRMPRAYAAAALIGTEGMDKEEEEEMETTMSHVTGVSLSRVSCPVWLVYSGENPNQERQIAYYRRANHSRDEMQEEAGSCLWLPEKGGDMDEPWCARVYAEKKPWEACVNREYSFRILTGLFDGMYRYPGNANGALRQAGDIYERGFQRFTADVWGGYYGDKRDTYCREWYVYVPNTASKAERLPAVFVFHGAGGSGDEIADRMGWSSVAEKHGFLLIMPTASLPNEIREISDLRTNNIFRAMWNTGNPQPERPSDLRFLDFLYQWLVKNYPVDRGRIYASGQSSGGMMSWACAAYRPGYFAAVAPFSARDIDIEAKERGEAENPPQEGTEIPVMANLGRCDTAFPGGFGRARELVDSWCVRGHLTKRWADYSYMDGSRCSFQEGEVTHYIFESKTGVPLLHLTETDEKAHATLPSECEQVWTQYFSRFYREPETGALRCL